MFGRPRQCRLVRVADHTILDRIPSIPTWIRIGGAAEGFPIVKAQYEKGTVVLCVDGLFRPVRGSFPFTKGRPEVRQDPVVPFKRFAIRPHPIATWTNRCSPELAVPSDRSESRKCMRITVFSCRPVDRSSHVVE